MEVLAVSLVDSSFFLRFSTISVPIFSLISGLFRLVICLVLALVVSFLRAIMARTRTVFAFLTHQNSPGRSIFLCRGHGVLGGRAPLLEQKLLGEASRSRKGLFVQELLWE